MAASNLMSEKKKSHHNTMGVHCCDGRISRELTSTGGSDEDHTDGLGDLGGRSKTNLGLEGLNASVELCNEFMEFFNLAHFDLGD